MVSARGRLSAALLLTKNKGRDTIIKKNVKPEGSVPLWKTRETSAQTEQAFLNVGTIEDAKEKAKQLLAAAQG